MGMSASQTRFLMLTAQKNNNEYQAQRITHERLVLSQDTESWTMEYNEKIDNKTLLFNVNNQTTLNYNQKLTYDDIVRAKDAEIPGLGARLVTTSGKIVVPELPEFDENGLSKDGLTRQDYFLDPEMKHSDKLQSALQNGVYFINMLKYHNDTDEKATWQEVSYNSTTQTLITETLDKTDDAAAQQEYDRHQKEFHDHDKMLELRLKQLESEHKALETEMESVQKVIKDNVESSFKTFG